MRRTVAARHDGVRPDGPCPRGVPGSRAGPARLAPVAGEWEGNGRMKRIVGWVIVALLIFLVVRNPATSADMVRSVWSGLVDVASGFGDFVSNLFSG